MFLAGLPTALFRITEKGFSHDQNQCHNLNPANPGVKGVWRHKQENDCSIIFGSMLDLKDRYKKSRGKSFAAISQQ